MSIAFVWCCMLVVWPLTLPAQQLDSPPESCNTLRHKIQVLLEAEETDGVVYITRLLEGRPPIQACDAELRIVVDLNLCKHYYRIGKMDSAAYYAQTAIELYHQDTTVLSPSQAAGAYAYYASTLYGQQQYAASLEWELKALRLREQHQLPSVALSHENIANNYMETGNYSKALSYFQQAETGYKALDDEESLAFLYHNIGNAYSKLHDLNQAQAYLQRAMEYAMTHEDPWLELDVLRVQAPISDELRDYLRLLEQTSRGIGLAVELEDSLSLLEFHNGRLTAHVRLLQLEKVEEDRRALESLLQAVPSAMERSIYYETLVPYFVQSDQYDSAAYYFQLHQAIEDSLKDVQLAEKVAELEARYEGEKKAQRIEFLELEANQQAQRERLYWVIGALLLLLALGLGLLYRWRTLRNRELRELNALKDQFFGIVAHDLKTPLVGFRSITEALQTHHTTLPPERVGYFLDQMHRAAHQLYDLLQNLLQWALSQTGRLRYAPEQLDGQALIHKGLDLLRPSATIRDIQLDQRLPAELSVWADPQLTQTILRNLLDNALKFTPLQGRVWVEAEAEGAYWRIRVCDTGVGMTAEQQAALFKGSHHSGSKVAGSGTGLGLVLCRELVERQGGRIGASSQLGKGSCFWFTLPQSPLTEPTTK